MDFNLTALQGRAALRWESCSAHPSLSPDQSQVALVALLYARILVSHEETREELFDRIGRAAVGLVDGDPVLNVASWLLHAGGLAFQIWPWTLTHPEHLVEAKKYIATLQSTARGALDIHLKMALLQVRILAPASALIAAYELSRVLDARGRLRLGRVLSAINGFYESPHNVRMITERKAMLAAMPALMT